MRKVTLAELFYEKLRNWFRGRPTIELRREIYINIRQQIRDHKRAVQAVTSIGGRDFRQPEKSAVVRRRARTKSELEFVGVDVKSELKSELKELESILEGFFKIIQQQYLTINEQEGEEAADKFLASFVKEFEDILEKLELEEQPKEKKKSMNLQELEEYKKKLAYYKKIKEEKRKRRQK